MAPGADGGITPGADGGIAPGAEYWGAEAGGGILLLLDAEENVGRALAASTGRSATTGRSSIG